MRELFAIATVLLVASHLAAQTETQLLSPSVAADLGTGTFGRSLILCDDLALVGVPFGDGACPDDPFFCNSGAAYAFRDSTGVGVFVEEAQLTASDGEALDLFGCAVAGCADRILIGARLDDDVALNAGAAYAFRLESGVWQQQQKVTASDGTLGDEFGFVVAQNETSAAVGAYKADVVGSDSGAVYLYQLTGGQWIEQDKITANDAAAGDWFGVDVALHGDRLLVGAPGDDDFGVTSGAAYTFRQIAGVWQQEAKLTASDAMAGHGFGGHVALFENFAVVGVPSSSGAGPFTGSAYVFRFANGIWTEEAVLTASDSAANSAFGASVSVYQHDILVGAPVADLPTAENCGATYWFRFNGIDWHEAAKLIDSAPSPNLQFGISTALWAGKALIGAMNDVAHIYVLEGEFRRGDCNQDGSFDIADAVSLLQMLFAPGGGSVPAGCDDSCDSNDDGLLNIADAVATLTALFATPAPMLPAPLVCGADPTADGIDCVVHAACP